MEQLRNFLQACKAKKENPVRDASQIGNLLHEVFDEMSKRSASRDHKFFYHTGFENVDAIIEGFEPGELVAIGGQPKSGRTALALHCAIQAAKEKQENVWIYSLKHSPHQMTKRLLSMLTGVPLRSIEDVRLTDKEWHAISLACTWLKDQDIRVKGLDVPIETLCDSMADAGSPGMLIIDDGFSKEIEVDVLKRLKELAEKNKTCVIVTSFYHDVHRYIAGEVDKVLFLWGFDEQTTTTCEVTWNRYGRIGDALLDFNEECLLFTEYSVQQEEDE